MKMVVKNALMAMALLTGCGGTALTQVGEDPAADVGTTQSAMSIDLRMRATGAEGFQSLMMLAHRVDVLVDGVPVPVELDGAPVELADMDQASRVASFDLPEGARELEFVVQVAPAGTFDRGAGLGWVDASKTTLRFKSFAETVREKGKAVVVLDAKGSLVDRGAETLALVPHFRVRY